MLILHIYSLFGELMQVKVAFIRGLIKNIQDKIFKRETTNSIKVTTMYDTWQHLLTPHTRGAGGSLTQS
jgi:hypothetical protein